MSRLRCGKWNGKGSASGGYSLTTSPFTAISAASPGVLRRIDAGQPAAKHRDCRAAGPQRPTVRGRVHPRASPLTTTTPRAARSAASRVAVSIAMADAARDPTIATAGWLRHARSPRHHNSGGQSSRVSSAGGNVGSFHATG